MSSLYRERTARASTLPTVSIRASITGDRAFYACAGVGPRNLIQNANQHRVPEVVPVCLCHKVESDRFLGSGWSRLKNAEAAGLFLLYTF